MKLDLSAAWDGAVKLIAANREVLVVLVGVFFFLPYLAVSLFVPELDQFGATAGESDPEVLMEAAGALYSEYWWVFLLLAVVQIVGTIAVMSVLGGKDRPTVGDGMQRGVRLFLTLLASQLLTGFVIGAVFVLLIALGAAINNAVAVLTAMLAVPAVLYLVTKFSMTSPIVAVQQEINPLAAIARSWKITKGNSFRLFFFYILLLVAFLVLSMVLSLVFGLAFALLGEDGALIGSGILSSLLNALFALVAYAVLVSVYKQLVEGSAAVSVPSTHTGSDGE